MDGAIIVVYKRIRSMLSASKGVVEHENIVCTVMIITLCTFHPMAALHQRKMLCLPTHSFHIPCTICHAQIPIIIANMPMHRFAMNLPMTQIYFTVILVRIIKKIIIIIVVKFIITVAVKLLLYRSVKKTKHSSNMIMIEIVRFS